MPYRDPNKAREAHRRWQAANRMKQREWNRIWRAANPEKASEATRRWKAANPERVRECARRRRERIRQKKVIVPRVPRRVVRDRAKQAAYERAWRKRNPEKVAAKKMRQYWKHPERSREIGRLYFARNRAKATRASSHKRPG